MSHEPAEPTAPAPKPRSRRGRATVALALTAAVAAWIGFGLWRTGGGPGDDPQAVVPALDAHTFAERAAQPEAFVVNVHVPYDGEIPGTDAFIRYDRIAGASELPHDRGVDILLYCRSGRMSEMAAQSLIAAGHTNVAHLDGGMAAWAAAGLDLRDRDR